MGSDLYETKVDPDQENQGYNLRAPQENLKTKHVSDPQGGREKGMIFKTLIFDRKLILRLSFSESPKNSAQKNQLFILIYIKL